MANAEEVRLEKVDDTHIAKATEKLDEAKKLENSKISAATEKLEAAADKLERATPKPPGFGSKLGRFFGKLFKWLLILAIIGGIGVGIYYGWPILNDRVIQPISDNTASVTALQGQIETNQTDLEALRSELGTLTDAEADFPGRVATLEDEIATVMTAQSDFDSRLSGIEGQIADSTTRLGTLEELQATVTAEVEAAGGESIRQLGVLRSMELLSRARLFLYQANYGLAEQDVQAARNVLADLAVQYPDSDTEAVTETLLRLDRTLDSLPAFPVQAIADLDIAWQTLLGEVPPPVPSTTVDEGATTPDTVPAPATTETTVAG